MPKHVDLVAVPEERAELFRRHEREGRSLGGERLVTRIERLVGRVLRPQNRGPKGPWKHATRRRNYVWCPATFIWCPATFTAP